MHPRIREVTLAIAERSRPTRADYMARMRSHAEKGKSRTTLSCANLAHTAAASSPSQKASILDPRRVNVGIVSAYSDMLSAHQPYATYPDQIKVSLESIGHSAQVACCVPSMCDGVTQGQEGMDLSLFSRDLIAQATAIGLCHNVFDAALLLGICDKIAPGQLVGALSFGHLPVAFVPSGPMPTGISNQEKMDIRRRYASGGVDKPTLQAAECRSYHAPGTCTFYGTANTNQLVFEAMGLMLPGSAFVAPDDPLRGALTTYTASMMPRLAQGSDTYRPLAHILDIRSLVNGLVALLSSGGSTNHTIHMIAIARAAGFLIDWNDFDALSEVVPLLARIYPNGPEDINAFQRAGGTPTLLRLLAMREMLHLDAMPMTGAMEDYLKTPVLHEGHLHWQPASASRDPEVIAPDRASFKTTGGLKVMAGNLGRGIIKVSAISSKHSVVEAPARIFSSQREVEEAYRAGELEEDLIVVVRHNGPAANGMPELHGLIPLLSNLQAKGFTVALVTDGRLSGASGKIPAVVHVTPEAQVEGPLSRLRTGDLICMDARHGTLNTSAPLEERSPECLDLSAQHQGNGRELFSVFRNTVSNAEQGASLFLT